MKEIITGVDYVLEDRLSGRRICPICGSKFKYEEKDVMVLKPKSFEGFVKYFATCPYCGQEISLHPVIEKNPTKGTNYYSRDKYPPNTPARVDSPTTKTTTSTPEPKERDFGWIILVAFIALIIGICAIFSSCTVMPYHSPSETTTAYTDNDNTVYEETGWTLTQYPA